MLFTVWREQQTGVDGQIAVYSFDDDTVSMLGLPGTQPQYTPTGHLVYARGNQILAVGFDPVRLQVTGTPVPVLENVLRAQGVAQISFADTGLMVYVPGDVGEAQHRLVLVDREGTIERIPGLEPGPYASPRLSPDGNRIAFFFGSYRAFDIWIHDLMTGNTRPVTFDGHKVRNFIPIWRDRENLAFERGTPTGPKIYSLTADGTGEPRALTSSPNSVDVPGSFSPSGALAFVGTREGIGRGIFVLSDGMEEPFLVTPALERAPMFSPDERAIAYVSDESGRDEVYVLPYPPTSGVPRKISTEGGTEPGWSRDGKELFYRSDDGMMMAVPVTPNPPGYGAPQPVFPDRFRRSTSAPTYDVTPDGQFLMVEEDPDNLLRVTVVHNWFEELKRLVPADN